MASPSPGFINTSNTSEAPSIKVTVKRRISSKAGECGEGEEGEPCSPGGDPHHLNNCLKWSNGDAKVGAHECNNSTGNDCQNRGLFPW